MSLYGRTTDCAEKKRWWWWWFDSVAVAWYCTVRSAIPANDSDGRSVHGQQPLSDVYIRRARINSSVRK